MNYVDKSGLSRFYEKLKTLLANKVDKVSGKGLSTNDYTTTEKSKLAGLKNYTLPTASSSVLGGVKVGSNLSISSGVLSATVPTKVSQLTNDSGFLTSVPSEYITETELNAKGYQNATQVNNTITAKGYQTSAQVESAITSKGYQTASQVNTAITSKGYITDADIASPTTTITIAASAWTSDNKYTVSDSRITATSNQEFLLPLYTGSNDAMIDAIQSAQIVDAGQSAGKAVIQCKGDKPTISIQLRIIFRGEK